MRACRNSIIFGPFFDVGIEHFAGHVIRRNGLAQILPRILQCIFGAGFLRVAVAGYPHPATGDGAGAADLFGLLHQQHIFHAKFMTAERSRHRPVAAADDQHINLVIERIAHPRSP